VAATQPDLISLVAEREGISQGEAREHARAVFAALGFVVSPVTAELPREFTPVVGPALLRKAPPPPE
jgi:hypothetical protein